MSVNYIFEIETELSVETIAKAFFEGYAGEILKKPYGTGIFMITDDFRVEVRKIEGDVTSFSASYGVKAKISLNFYSVALREDRDGYACILGLVNQWLGNTSGDVAFIYEGDTIIVLRISGEVQLNSFGNFWSPRYEQLITVPYRFASIPPI